MKTTFIERITPPYFGVLCVVIAIATLMLFLCPKLFDAASIIALVALFVAIVTLRAVYRQIVLAEHQLKLATEELFVVNRDFAMSQELFIRSNRKAHLSIRTKEPSLPAPNYNPGFLIPIDVANSGDATCKGFRCILALPQGYQINSMTGSDGWSLAENHNFNNPKLSGYTYYQKDFDTLVYPDDHVICGRFNGQQPGPEQPHNHGPIYWRLIYQDGQNPDTKFAFRIMTDTFDPSEVFNGVIPAGTTLTIKPRVSGQYH